MGKDKFELYKNGETCVLRNGNTACFIRQAVDEDIFFSTAEEKMELKLEAGSRNYSEWQTYLVFEELMKSVFGRYILNDYLKYQSLPEDFIDLENKIITWHSDSGTDNVLKLRYLENAIKITITKEKGAAHSKGNIVRIRTAGSDYGYYYQEFLAFYRKLVALEGNINKDDSENNRGSVLDIKSYVKNRKN